MYILFLCTAHGPDANSERNNEADDQYIGIWPQKIVADPNHRQASQGTKDHPARITTHAKLLISNRSDHLNISSKSDGAIISCKNEFVNHLKFIDSQVPFSYDKQIAIHPWNMKRA